MRVKKGPASRHRKNRLLKKAKGYSRSRNNRIRLATATVMRAQKFANRDRKVKKRQFRSLWIARLNAACRPLGLSYSRLIHGLAVAKISIDRKMLAHLAVTDAETFAAIAQIAKEHSATENRAAA